MRDRASKLLCSRGELKSGAMSQSDSELGEEVLSEDERKARNLSLET